MISNKTFAAGFALLCAQHGRQANNPELMRLWKRLLDEHLDDQDYQDAISASIFTDKYWPTPKQLIGHVRRILTPKEMAENAWVAVSSVLSSREKELRLDTPGEIALSAVGGRSHLSRIAVNQLSFVRKDFIAAYCAAAPSRDSYQPISEGVARPELQTGGLIQ